MSDSNINKNIAVYIDGDNANYKDFNFVYEEIKKHGRIIIGKIYGDWTKTEMRGWKDVSMNYALESINCFSLSRKNSTDIYLICDILYDLYNNSNIDVYIIVSSDSDYTHVTKRIRSEGKKAIGIGRKNTPLMLKNSCDIFISTDVIKNNDDDVDDDEDSSENTDYLQYSMEDKNLLNILKAFKGNKKIVISKLKKNLCKICDAKKIYNHDEYMYFDNYLKKHYSDNFRIIEKNKTVKVINITDIIETINNIFERLNKQEFNLSLVKDTLLLKDPTFDQRSYGFSTMKDFILNLFDKEYEIIQSDSAINIKKK